VIISETTLQISNCSKEQIQEKLNIKSKLKISEQKRHLLVNYDAYHIIIINYKT